MFKILDGIIKEIRITSIIIRNKSEYIPKQRLCGKVAIITGSTAGIGFGIARRLGKEGAQIIVSSRKEENVKKAVKKLESEGIVVCGIPCHVAKEKDRKQLYETAIESFEGIDIVVSNTGTNPHMGSMFDFDEKMWDKVFEVNVKASFLLTKEVYPFLKKRKGGSIVFVSSIGGYVPLDCLGVYSVTKTAVIGLTKALAKELADENINVNAVAPGIIETKFSKSLYEKEPSRSEYLRQIPMQRFGTPNDIAKVVAFLVSDDARYITGEIIPVTGGMASHL